MDLINFKFRDHDTQNTQDDGTSEWRKKRKDAQSTYYTMLTFGCTNAHYTASGSSSQSFCLAPLDAGIPSTHPFIPTKRNGPNPNESVG